jgi:leader peptidase (prepilin peptidase)/N-methyltransferase
MTSTAYLLDFFPLAACILGLILGSFSNVCIHRYIKGESIVLPTSHCPLCKHKLAWWENIPLLSYLLLWGKCRSCREDIHWRYPVVEGISGLWALLLALKFGPETAFAVYLFFGQILIIISFIDLEIFILPDIYTLPGSVAALAATVLFLGLPWSSSLIGALAGGGTFLILQQGYKWLKGRDGLGAGDIKLMFLLGALLGWQALPLVVFMAAVSALTVSLVYLRQANAKGLQTAIPFGPFLSLGGMLYILTGPQILHWYLGL